MQKFEGSWIADCIDYFQSCCQHLKTFSCDFHQSAVLTSLQSDLFTEIKAAETDL